MEDIEGLFVGLFVVEMLLESELLWEVCYEVYKEWVFVYEEKLWFVGCSESYVKEVSIVINVMIEGGIFLFLMVKNSILFFYIFSCIFDLLKR